MRLIVKKKERKEKKEKKKIKEKKRRVLVIERKVTDADSGLCTDS